MKRTIKKMKQIISEYVNSDFVKRVQIRDEDGKITTVFLDDIDVKVTEKEVKLITKDQEQSLLLRAQDVGRGSKEGSIEPKAWQEKLLIKLYSDEEMEKAFYQDVNDLVNEKLFKKFF